MTKTEMSKAHKKTDKMRLITHEEAAFEEQEIKYEANSCARRCKVLLFYGVLIGMLIILYNFILLGWQSYMKQFGSNETLPAFALYGIPLLHIDEKLDINEDLPTESENVYGNINRRIRRSPQKVIGIQSENEKLDKEETNPLHDERKNDDPISYHDSLYDDSSDLEKILQQLLAGERMVSNNHASDRGFKQELDHHISENEDKEIIHSKILNENKELFYKNKENSQSNDYEYKDGFHYKTAQRNYMQNFYHLIEENESKTLSELYYGIIIIFGILLIFALCLCIKFFYDFISIKFVNKHKRLQEEKDHEINKRLDPLKCEFPSTPVDKDLRFTVNREKMDMFCDLYDPN